MSQELILEPNSLTNEGESTFESAKAEKVVVLEKVPSHRLIDLFFVLFVSLPVCFILINLYLLQKIFDRDGQPFLFRSSRIGRNGKMFTQYKIRTKLFRDTGTGANHKVMFDKKLGRFIRKTRLDMLPQIWNVFLGEMSFVGPVAQRKIDSYELTYLSNNQRIRKIYSRPGICRLSRLNYSKKLYGRVAEYFENKMLRVEKSSILYFWAVTNKAFQFCIRLFFSSIDLITSKISGVYRPNQRRFDRIGFTERTKLHLYNPDYKLNILGRPLEIYDMNYEALSFSMPELLEEGRKIGMKIIWEGKSTFGVKKKKSIYCQGSLYRKQSNSQSENIHYVLYYETKNPLDRFRIDHYLLKEICL